MTDTLPDHLRPITFAANELMLDMIYQLLAYTEHDLESVLILLCVTDATMRPFMLDEELAPTVMRIVRPPDAIRGAISRRMIADKTGLSRETVRRKTKRLAKAGLVVIDADGGVRAAQRLGEVEFQRLIENGHRAVLRYLLRLQRYGVDVNCVKA